MVRADLSYCPIRTYLQIRLVRYVCRSKNQEQILVFELTIGSNSPDLLTSLLKRPCNKPTTCACSFRCASQTMGQRLPAKSQPNCIAVCDSWHGPGRIARELDGCPRKAFVYGCSLTAMTVAVTEWETAVRTSVPS